MDQMFAMASRMQNEFVTSLSGVCHEFITSLSRVCHWFVTSLSESTRPGAISVTLTSEMTRVIPIIEELIKKIRIPLSIDTYKSAIAEKALDLGVGMINDISALRMDKNLGNIISRYNVPVCLMHMKGSPDNMQKNPKYEDVIGEIKSFLKERISYALY